MGVGKQNAFGRAKPCSWAVRPLKFTRAALVVHSGLPQNPHGPLGPELHHTASPCRGSRSSRSAASCRRRPPPRPLAGPRRWLRRLFPAGAASSYLGVVSPGYILDPLLDFSGFGFRPSLLNSELLCRLRFRIR